MREKKYEYDPDHTCLNEKEPGVQMIGGPHHGFGCTCGRTRNHAGDHECNIAEATGCGETWEARCRICGTGLRSGLLQMPDPLLPGDIPAPDELCDECRHIGDQQDDFRFDPPMWDDDEPTPAGETETVGIVGRVTRWLSK